MSSYTLAEVQADIATTRAAITDILSNGQSVGSNGRQYTAANLGDLRSHMQYLMSLEQSLSRGGIRGRRAVTKR